MVIPVQQVLRTDLTPILWTTPNLETLQFVKRVIESPRFEVEKATIQASLLEDDGHHMIYESINPFCPEEITTAIASMTMITWAQQCINYFNILSKEATSVQIPKTIQNSGAWHNVYLRDRWFRFSISRPQKRISTYAQGLIILGLTRTDIKLYSSKDWLSISRIITAEIMTVMSLKKTGLTRKQYH